MKHWMILAAVAARSLSAVANAAAPAAHEGHPGRQASAAQASYSGVGVVRKADAAQGKVTLEHEPIAALVRDRRAHGRMGE